MKPSEYLTQLLKDQTITKDSSEAKELQAHRADVEAVIMAAFDEDKPKIRYAGSYSKGTMIRDSYDLDIACYFPESKDDSLPEIRQQVQNALSEKYYITPKASALRIEGIKDEPEQMDYHIDVVPGRFVDDTETDAFLHIAYGEKERMKTNLDKHIEFVTNSGRQDVLKLAKLWNSRNQIRAKSFVLDIFIIESLKGYTGTDLENTFKKALQEIADRFETAEIVDPANTGNVVSKVMTDPEKQNVASRAKDVLKAIEDAEDATDAWKTAFLDTETKAASSYSSPVSAPTPISAPLKPWVI